MKKVLILLLVSALMLGMFAGCASQSNGTTPSASPTAQGSTGTQPAASETPKATEPAPTDKPIVLKLGTNAAATDPETNFSYRVAELVLEKSNGAIKIDVYDSAQLGDHTERLEGLRMGTIDMTQVSLDYLAAYIPVMALFGGPYLFVDEKHQNRAYNNGELKNVIEGLIEPEGFVLVQPMELGARHITNNTRPIKTLADLKGLKIRVPDTKASIDTLTYLGAAPTPLAFSELYMALSQKVVDGQENPLSTASHAKLFEVQKYLSLTGHQRLEQVLLFSKMNWDKLSDNQKNIIFESCKTANDELIAYFTESNAELISEFEAAGVLVNEVDDINEFIKAVEPFRADYIAKFGDTAKQIYDLIDAAK